MELFKKPCSLKKIGIIVLLVLVLLVFPRGFTRADGIFSAITGLGLDTLVSGFFVILFGVIGQITSWLMGLFKLLVYVRVDAGLPVLTATWTILRNFANMLFIVALIWMAFGTIFNLPRYSFKDLILRFLIVAITINFSLAIGGLVIDAAQVLTNVFLASIGDPAARIGQYLNPGTAFFGNISSSDAAKSGILDSSMLPLIFSVILSAIFMFSVLVATAFAFFRIFILWALLIISPIAWMANILPSTQHRFKQWWSLFLGWAFFLPVYLFFLNLGLVFLSQKDTVTAAIFSNSSSNPSDLVGSSSIALNMTFFYIFAAFVLSGASWAAVKLTSQFGDGFQGGFNWARGIAGRVTGYDAARKAGQQKYKEVTEGVGSRLPGIVSGTKQEAFFGRMFRTEGAEFKTQKDFATNAKKQFDTLTEEYNTNKLTVQQLQERAKTANPLTPSGYAYIKLAAQKGALDDKRFRDTLVALKSNPLAVNDLVKTAADAKFFRINELKKIALDKDVPVSARRDILNYIKTNARAAGSFAKGDEGRDELSQAAEALGGKDSPETRRFLDDFVKLRPDLVYGYKSGGENFYMDDQNKQITREGFWRKAVRTEAKNLADMPTSVWGSQDFQNALTERVNELDGDRAKNTYRRALEKILTEKGEVRSSDPAKPEKLNILDKVVPLIKVPPKTQGGGPQGETTEVENEEEETVNEETGESTPPENESPQTPPTASTVSYHGSPDVSEDNVIDLRNNKQ